MVQLSVIIVNYNVHFFLEQCLRSVEAASKTIPVQIIVIDNNSSDGSCQMIKDKFPQVLLIENKINIGFAKANNQGAAKAEGGYLLMLNPDTVLAEDTFEKLITFVRDKSKCGAVGIKLIDGAGNFLPESKRNLPKPKVALNKIFGDSSAYYVNRLEENQNGEVDVLVGAFMLMKRNVYNEVGGLDEDYFMYGEDIDLSYKLLKKGYKNYYFGEITAIHYKGESTIKDTGYLKHFHKAMVIFYRKHFKSNVFYNFIIFLGIQLAYLHNSFKIKKKRNSARKNQNILYIGNNERAFERIKKHIIPAKATKQHTIKDLFFDKHAVHQVFFDNNYFTNKEVIKTLEGLKKYDISFRILPRTSTFYIGSDSSDGRGEVVQLVE